MRPGTRVRINSADSAWDRSLGTVIGRGDFRDREGTVERQWTLVEVDGKDSLYPAAPEEMEAI